MGDLNTDLLINSISATQLKNIFHSCNLSILPLQPTHHTSSSETLLDLIVTSQPQRILRHGQLPVPGLSAHDLIFAEYSLQCPKKTSKILTYRALKNIDVTELTADAIQLPWSSIWNLRTVDEKIDTFNSLVLQLYDKHAPTKTKRLKRSHAPWLTESIRDHMSRRDEAFRKFKRNKTDENWQIYKQFRNKTTQMIRNSKLRHAHSLIEPSTNTRELWNNLREMGIGQNKTPTDPLNIPLDVLNYHFTSASTSHPDIDLKQQAIDELSTAPIPDREKFYFTNVTDLDVKIALQRIKTKAQGTDRINIMMLNLILDVILPTLSHIFNASLITSTYPQQWKYALVHPLPKIAKPMTSNDYRPISILPTLSKALERIVYKQLTAYLGTHNLLDTCQSGFRNNHSTTTALLKISEDIREAIDRREVTVLTLIDFSRAFDSVDFDILISKLRQMHLSDSAVTWMDSYLRDRQQCVYHDNRSSSWRRVRAGVPQGSVLGPLLFTLYINDISSVLEHCQYHLYADDLQVYTYSRPDSLNERLSSLNDDLLSISNWARKFGLNLNPDKTQAILLGQQRLLSSINMNTLQSVSLNNTIIPFSITVKNLGIYFDSNMNWNTQIRNICRKVFSIMHSLKRLKNFLPTKLKEILVQTLVMPHFDYCDVLYSNLSAELSQKLQRVHNVCVRFIFNIRRHDHISEYFLRLSWLRLQDRRLVHSLCLLYRIIHDSTPNYLASRFTLLASHHNRNTRSQHNLLLSIPHHQTSLYSSSFSIAMARSWNSLPLEIRGSLSPQTFKIRLFRHILNAEN